MVGSELDLDLDRVATGGAALGRGPDGRVVFVTGALPGERVTARVSREHRRRLEADTVTVLDPSPGRVAPGCAHVADGCGGCDWQHADEVTQQALRREVVIDCLRRLARIDDPPVTPGPALPGAGYRTTVRAAVVGGRAGFRAARSHSVVVVDTCLVAHPLVEEVLVEGRFGSASEVTIRAGANTGERLLLVAPTAEGVVVPDDVIVVGQDEIDAGRRAVYHEEIDGRRLQISAPAFFQCRADGALALTELVAEALGPVEGTLLDAYCGVGLFGACLDLDRPVIGVEASPWSAADAEVNYAATRTPTSTGPAWQVVRSKVEAWAAHPVGAVVADPARAGLGRGGAASLAATGAPVVALVSCDPAALARDVTLLDGQGYQLEWVRTLDLFGQTSHVETVSRLVRR